MENLIFSFVFAFCFFVQSESCANDMRDSRTATFSHVEIEAQNENLPGANW